MFCLSFQAYSKNSPNVLPGEKCEFGISFPPLSSKKGFDATKHYLDDLGVKFIRFDIHWKHREPQKDSFVWKPQDRRMEFLHRNGFIPVLTFHADAPDWVRDMLPTGKQNKLSVALNSKANQRFARFVAAFIERYKSKYPELLQYFQYGNEWLSKYWYIGTSRDFVKTQNIFYKTIKKQLPKAKVILGGLASGQVHAVAVYDGLIEKFYDNDGKRIDKKYIGKILKSQQEDIQSGKLYETVFQRLDNILNEARYDWFDIHLYDDYRLWPECLKAIKNRLQAKNELKFVVTEFGGPHPSMRANISEEKFALLLQKYLNTLENLDIEFALFFSLVRKPKENHPRSGLLGYESGKIIEYPVYEVFKVFNKGR
jgi:hypothetical protein